MNFLKKIGFRSLIINRAKKCKIYWIFDKRLNFGKIRYPKFAGNMKIL